MDMHLLYVGRCPNPTAPANGVFTLTGTQIGDRVFYYCHYPFERIGDLIRECRSNMEWSGSVPSCSLKGIIICFIYEASSLLARESASRPSIVIGIVCSDDSYVHIIIQLKPLDIPDYAALCTT